MGVANTLDDDGDDVIIISVPTAHPELLEIGPCRIVTL